MSGTVRVESQDAKLRREAETNIQSQRDYLGQVNPMAPETVRFNEAINRLERAARAPGDSSWLTGHRLTDTQKKEISDATRGVTDSRRALEQARAMAPDRVERNPPQAQPRATGNTPRECGPGTAPRPEQRTPASVQNPNEPGIRRDPGTGEVIGRDPGAHTALENSVLNGSYGKNGRYERGPTREDVAAGRRVLMEGMKSPVVSQIQDALRRQGFDPGRSDTFWGPKTQRAVQAWMQKNNMQGSFDHQALQRLLGA